MTGYTGLRPDKNLYKNREGIFNNDSEPTDRTIRRDRERAMSSFNKRVYLTIDKDLWNCISHEDRYDIYWKWVYSTKQEKYLFVSFIEDSVSKIKSKYLDRYRELKLNKLLK